MAQLPKGGLVRGYDNSIHGSCAIYFPGGINRIPKKNELMRFSWQPAMCEVYPLGT